MTRTHIKTEVNDIRHPEPVHYVEDPLPIALPFGDEQVYCRSCGAHWWPDEIESDRCPTCESDQLEEVLLGCIDVIGTEPDGKNGTCRILLRSREAPRFFERLDRTLRHAFGVRLVATIDCDPGTRGRLLKCSCTAELQNRDTTAS